MLNISLNSINERINRQKFPALARVEARTASRIFLKAISALAFLAIVIMFLPWTQNIRARGNVTALNPAQRPQAIHSVIGGRIEKWFVQEGDLVNRGDTILFISEVKDEYFAPDLLENTASQLEAKELSVKSYMDKISALDNQIDALIQTSRLKLEQSKNKLQQAKLKIVSDSMDFEAAQINFKVAEDQLKRMEALYNDGLKSLTDLENRRLTKQKQQAAMISAENKLLTSKNEEINARVEITSLKAQYEDAIAKAESDKYTAMSNMYDAEATVTKLQNQYTNYSIRTGLYYITAPQDGYITKAVRTGVGETVKEGEEIITIMPSNYDLAVEVYIKPLDFPLVQKGQEVRIQFDGWPSIIFSGWPNTSYGTYGGEVFAIDNFISKNGLYRILVVPDPDQPAWPSALRPGAGTNSMMLLKDVQIWYELWRQINGFPPDYYISETTKTANK